MKWLRRIISEEVAKVTSEFKSVEGRLAAERDVVVSDISAHVKACTSAIEAETHKLLVEVEEKMRKEAGAIMAEKNLIIAELQTRLSAVQETVSKISHWKADSETVAADHSLKLRK